MTFDWHTEYARALSAFGGDTPSATLEQDILDAFTQHPQAVTNAITKIGKAYAAGKIHSPWGALKTEIPKQVARDVQVGDGNERSQATANSEQWMRNTGLMYDRWNEAHDELFGDRGRLHPWRKDHQLETRIHTLYDELRLAGIAVEHAELERADQWKTSQAALATKPKNATPQQWNDPIVARTDAQITTLPPLEPDLDEAGFPQETHATLTPAERASTEAT